MVKLFIIALTNKRSYILFLPITSAHKELTMRIKSESHPDTLLLWHICPNDFSHMSYELKRINGRNSWTEVEYKFL